MQISDRLARHSIPAPAHNYRQEWQLHFADLPLNRKPIVSWDYQLIDASDQRCHVKWQHLDLTDLADIVAALMQLLAVACRAIQLTDWTYALIGL